MAEHNTDGAGDSTVSAHSGGWVRLCGDCWQDHSPTEYLPNVTNYGECEECGAIGLTYGQREAAYSHTFGNGVRCTDLRPLVWANSEDCLHDDGADQH